MMKAMIQQNSKQNTTAVYRKYPNLVRTQMKIISDPNYLVRIFIGR